MTHLTAIAPTKGRLDAIVAEVFGELSRSRAASLIKAGAVRVDGEPVTRPAAKVTAGAALALDLPDPAPDTAVPQDLPLRIVYEDASVVVIDKVAGMVVHPSAGHADGTLVNALLHHTTDLSGIGGVRRPGIVHRLDRGTSGLLVVAKSDHAHHHLAAQFAAHTAGRRYLALCHGAPTTPSGTIRSLLARHPTDRLRWASTDGSYGKEAITHWQRLAHTDTVSLISCRLETGRTHQIRVHLTEAELPLVGDSTYKRRRRRIPESLQSWLERYPGRPLLHAWGLRFEHPETDEALLFEAELPTDFLEALDAVGMDWSLIREAAAGR